VSTVTIPAPTTPVPNAGASFFVSAVTVAGRTVKKFVRSPQLIVAGTVQGAMFLLIFRYVFGGAIAHTGAVSYVDYFVPGFVVTSVLFSGMGSSAGVAEDVQAGLSPQPAHRPPVGGGRTCRSRYRAGGLEPGDHRRLRLSGRVPRP
jgi:hypothetical protein